MQENIYNNYQSFLQKNIDIHNFKSNNTYQQILEHVTTDYGNKYLDLILDEFPQIDFSILHKFCIINDLYGKPIKYNFIKNNHKINCSPTSLRYIYHALIILKYLKTTNCKNIVEVGCGYGGLCLAINYFMNIFDIEITNYHIIDLEEPLNLI